MVFPVIRRMISMLGSLAGSASAATARSLSRAVALGEARMNPIEHAQCHLQHTSAARCWWLAALCAALALLAGGARAADRTPFDHLTTGFDLIGPHRDLPSESCHLNALFKGTPPHCRPFHRAPTA